MMKNLLLLFILLGSFSFGQEKDYKEWIYVTTGSDGNPRFVRTFDGEKPVRSASGNIMIWRKETGDIYFINDNGQKELVKNGKDIQKIEIDCRKRKVKLMSSYVYDSTGKVLDSMNFENFTSWDDVVPDSVGETILIFVCNEL